MGGGEVLKEGYLIKSPPDKSKTWRKRWFRLRSSRILEYYHSPDGKLKGVVNLEDCTTVHMTLAHKKHKHVFGIETKSRLYFLVASSDNEMKEWVEAIIRICGLVAESTTHVSKEVSSRGAGVSSGDAGVSSGGAGVISSPQPQATESRLSPSHRPPDQRVTRAADPSPPPPLMSPKKGAGMEPEAPACWPPPYIAMTTVDPADHYDRVPTQDKIAAQERKLAQERVPVHDGYDVPRMALESKGYVMPRHVQPIAELRLSPTSHGSPGILTPSSSSRPPSSTQPTFTGGDRDGNVYNVPRGSSTLPNPSKKAAPAIKFEDVDLPPPPPPGDGDWPPGDGGSDDERYVNVLRTPQDAPPPQGAPPLVDRTRKPQPPRVDRDLKPRVPRPVLVDSSPDGDMPRPSARTVAYTLVSFTPNQPAVPVHKPRPSNYTQVDLPATQALAAKVMRQSSAPLCGSRPKIVPHRAAFEEEFENDDGDDDGDGDIVSGYQGLAIQDES